MYDIAILGAGITAFGIIGHRVAKMTARAIRENRRKRLLQHLDWGVDEFGRPRRRA